MTLCISLLTDEGVVIATDSMGQLECIQPIKLPCSTCNDKKQDFVYDGPLFCGKTEFCQKLFEINKWSCLSIAEDPCLGNKNHYVWIDEFISFLKRENPERFDEMKINEIPYNFELFLKGKKMLENNKNKTDLMFSGIDSNNKSKCYIYNIENDVIKFNDINEKIIYIGQYDKLDLLFKDNLKEKYLINDLPLQDAINFSEMLINIQILLDKYSNVVPAVGGSIDIALIHISKGFKWIKQKGLSKYLDE